MAKWLDAWRSNLRARRLVAGICGAAAGVALVVESDAEPVVFLPASLLCGAAVLIHLRPLGAQLLARAIWWANLVLGEFLALTSSSSERTAGSWMVLGCGAAIIAVDRRGLVAATKRQGYNPVGFRGTLILAMILALADTQSLLLFVLVSLKNGGSGIEPELLTGCAVAMIVAFVGLYRLAWWGIVGNIIANVAVAGLALSGALLLPNGIVAMLVTTAVLQLLVPIPMIVTLIGRRPFPLRLAPSHQATLTTVLVALLMALAVLAAWFYEGKLLQF